MYPSTDLELIYTTYVCERGLKYCIASAVEAPSSC